jgi:hypothetical protein
VFLADLMSVEETVLPSCIATVSCPCVCGRKECGRVVMVGIALHLVHRHPVVENSGVCERLL